MEREPDCAATGLAVAHDETFFEKTFKSVLDNFFEERRPHFCAAERAWIPPTDIFETSDAIHIKMEVAGVRDEDIEVKVSDNLLVVRGRRGDEQSNKKENFHLMEIQYGVFERAFGLPTFMEVKNITASLKNGFLLITIPKDTRLREYRIRIE
jgi:HSP20 family protein